MTSALVTHWSTLGLASEGAPGLESDNCPGLLAPSLWALLTTRNLSELGQGWCCQEPLGSSVLPIAGLEAHPLVVSYLFVSSCPFFFLTPFCLCHRVSEEGNSVSYSSLFPSVCWQQQLFALCSFWPEKCSKRTFFLCSCLNGPSSWSVGLRKQLPAGRGHLRSSLRDKTSPCECEDQRSVLRAHLHSGHLAYHHAPFWGEQDPAARLAHRGMAASQAPGQPLLGHHLFQKQLRGHVLTEQGGLPTCLGFRPLTQL